ncbi:hypothetical protein [Vibrio owensii]|uniref:hypothetical protein n=1 Tax=Vibrio harveyi group TaxID=717610 RepID=UPI003CC63032
MFTPDISIFERTFSMTEDHSDFSMPFVVNHALYPVMYLPLMIKATQASIEQASPDFFYFVTISEGSINLSTESRLEIPDFLVPDLSEVSELSIESRENGWNVSLGRANVVSIYNNDEGIVVDLYVDGECYDSTYVFYSEIVSDTSKLEKLMAGGQNSVTDYKASLLLEHSPSHDLSKLCSIGGYEVLLMGSTTVERDGQFLSNAEMLNLLDSDAEFSKWLQDGIEDKHMGMLCSSNPWFTYTINSDEPTDSNKVFEDLIFDNLSLDLTMICLSVAQLYS